MVTFRVQFNAIRSSVRDVIEEINPAHADIVPFHLGILRYVGRGEESAIFGFQLLGNYALAPAWLEKTAKEYEIITIEVAAAAFCFVCD